MSQVAIEGDVVPPESVASTDEIPRLGIDGMTVNVDGARVVIEEQTASTTDPTSLAEELRNRRNSAVEIGRRMGWKHPEDFGARLAIRPSTPWHDVVTTFDALARAGFPRVGVVFIGQTSVVPPAKTTVSQWFEEHPAKSKPWDNPVEAPTRALLQCKKLITPMVATTGERIGRSMINRTFHEEVPEAMRSCDCDVDDEAVKAMIWWANGRYGGAPTLTHTIVPASRGQSGSIEVKGGPAEPWASIAPRVVEAASKNVPLALADN